MGSFVALLLMVLWTAWGYWFAQALVVEGVSRGPVVGAALCLGAITAFWVVLVEVDA